MSEFAPEEQAAYYRQHFEEGLLRCGFQGGQESGWTGPITHNGLTTDVLISLPGNFPFWRPRVTPLDKDSVPWTWHRERDGSLCLVSDDDHDDLWWREAPDFLAHITAWFLASDAGWMNDRPDLDLERYFEPADDPALYCYPDLDAYRDDFIRFVPRENNVMWLHSRMKRPDNPPKKFRRDRFGYVVVIGDLAIPPRDWRDISAIATARIDLDRAIRLGSVQVVLVEYDRRGYRGVLALQVRVMQDGSVDARGLASASDAPSSRLMRSGRDAPLLADRNVAVVGVGAIGSFVADMLIRVGVGRLTLLDHDRVHPGNLPRHLVGADAIGLKKADATKRYLVERYKVAHERITARGDCLLHPATAEELLGSHDLVINATADYSVTALLHETAIAVDCRFISVALQNDGDTVRVDVLPPLAGFEALPNSAAPPDGNTFEKFDAGCGSPVSPSSPSAVIEAAAVATRHAVALLVSRPIHPSGEVRHLSEVRRG